MIALKINKIWEKRAKEESPYDVVYGRFQGNRLKELLKESEVKKLEKKGTEEIVIELNVKGKKVLDAGIGPLARFSSVFSEFGADVIGIDISRSTIESARSALKDKPVNLILADIMNLPFKEGTFNISFCYGTIYHMPGGRMGVEKALKELARVTKKKEIIFFNVENYLNPINWPQIIGRKVLKVLGANLPPHIFFNYLSLRKIIEIPSELCIIEIKTAFEVWGPLIFLPTPILKGIVKIWMPLSRILSKISNKIHFLRFLGTDWLIKVKRL